MLASQLFWRIFAIYAALTVVSTLVFAGLLSVRHRAALDEALRDRLRDDAVMVRELWFAQSPKNRPEFDAVLASFSGGIEILSAEDASKSPDSEVRQALSTGEGLAERPSTTGRSEVRFALRLGPADAAEGVVRVTRPKEYGSPLGWFSVQFWGAALAMIAVGLSLTYRVVGRIIQPLAALTQVARQIAAGEAPHKASIHSRNELGELGQAFDSMNRQLALRIADLQQQRRRLQHNNEQLETVLGAMVEGVIAVDDQERVLLANNAAFRLLEMTPNAMVGRPIWEALREPRIDELVRQALKGESPERLEFQVSRAQNIISVAVSRLPGEPCPGAVLVLHDVTELRRLERLRREFVANVSHELKTPLTSIAAYTETLLDGALDDPAHNKEFLRRIEEQTDRLQALIGDLLSLARMESDESAFELAPVDATDVVAASVEAHLAVAESKGIRLSLIEPAAPADVLADAEGVRTIVDNLLDNALNYTPSGGEVAVRCSTDGTWLQIDVSDTGVGIALEHQSRIFERFFRVDKARSREIGGTGLGLAIVKHLCQVFGGTVSVSSQLGRGSTFTVRLRVVQREAVG